MYSANMVRIHCHNLIWILSAIVVVLFWAGPASAHASEQGFVLLLPTGAYIAGGTVAVGASILLVTVLNARMSAVLFRPIQLGQSLRLPKVIAAINVASTCLFLVLIGIGLFGPTDPQANLLPLTFWTVVWVGVFVLQGLVFDVWRWINPWAGLHRVLMGDSKPIYQLPGRLAAWPAVFLFVMFQIFAIADIAPSDPRRLANVAVGYWVFTFLGMVVFGRRAWLSQVELFSVLFDVIGRLRPLRCNKKTQVGVPGWNAIARSPLDISLAMFCLVVLATGSFDGLHETFWWLAKIGINPLEFPGRSAIIVTSTVGALAAIVALTICFAIAVWVGIWMCGWIWKAHHIGFTAAFCALSVSILPIAFGYHFAHFLVSFLVQIQYVALVSGDPFAVGWNVANLADVRITTGFLKSADTVKTIWFTQAGAVVASHILAVMMGHHIATGLTKTRTQALMLQVGLSALMIVYTLFGLWLLASPRGM